MSKFNKTSARPAHGMGFIASETLPSGLTHEGAPGFKRDQKSELFLMSVTNFVGEKTFYEPAGDRDSRFVQLIHEVAVADSAWIGRFLPWLRSEGNMRSASIVGAVETAWAMLKAGIPGGRRIVASVLQRADEPGEAVAYFHSRYGRTMPIGIKRGIADGAAKLYTEYSALKYDTASKGYRFADVLGLTHAKPDFDLETLPLDKLEVMTSEEMQSYRSGRIRRQEILFKWLNDSRYWRDTEIPPSLDMIRNNASLRQAVTGGDYSSLTNAEVLRAAGMTWEDVLSLAGDKVDKAALWEALIPTMGYMALLRNLRNFDEAGVSKEAANAVITRLADPEQVARSRQFPFRFLSAYEAAPSLRWGQALDEALGHSLKNLPSLPGRTLILVDTSASMTSMSYSAKSKVTPAKAAAVFGVALAAKGENVSLHGFADGVFEHRVPAGGSVVKEVAGFLARTGCVGHGTNIAGSLRATYKGHDRVVLISDMQTMGGYGYARGVSESIPTNIPLYGFNLGGNEHAAFSTANPNRVEFGGLTDQTFRTIPLIEASKNASWPWMK